MRTSKIHPTNVQETSQHVDKALDLADRLTNDASGAQRVAQAQQARLTGRDARTLANPHLCITCGQLVDNVRRTVVAHG